MTLVQNGATEVVAWQFHPLAGTDKHGPTLDKPQTKIWRSMDSWWALLVRDEAIEMPELAIFELVGDVGSHDWRDTGITVATDPHTTGDAHFDATQLWIATRAPNVGVALQRFFADSDKRTWLPDDAGEWRIPTIATPSISVSSAANGLVWVTYADGQLPWCASGAIDQFPHLSDPIPVPGSSPTLIDVDLSAVVRVEDGVGIFWSDQGTETFHFAISSGDGKWTNEIVATGGLVADDHVAIRSHDGRLYAAVKTSKDNDPERASTDSLLLLLVREPSGEWHDHQIATVDQPVTRPIPLLDPEGDRVCVLYTYGPNPGERTIRMKSAPMATLDFPPGDGEIVIGHPDAQINDVTGSREPFTRASGAVVLASAGQGRHYYYCYFSQLPIP